MFKENLQNKKIIVAGGSSGIGLSVAKMAAAFGAQVTITSRNVLRAKTALATLQGNLHFEALEVNDEHSVDTFFQRQTDIDHIYIAAGSTKVVSLHDTTLNEAMVAFDERILGSLRIVKAAVKKIQPGGSITFTGGISTDRPISGAWVSGLGTATAEQLARVMAMEFPHIRFNAISPGYTDTPMWDTILGENKAAVLNAVAEKLPVKKIATAEEVAAAVIFFDGQPICYWRSDSHSRWRKTDLTFRNNCKN